MKFYHERSFSIERVSFLFWTSESKTHFFHWNIFKNLILLPWQSQVINIKFCLSARELIRLSKYLHGRICFLFRTIFDRLCRVVGKICATVKGQKKRDRRLKGWLTLEIGDSKSRSASSSWKRTRFNFESLIWRRRRLKECTINEMKGVD